MDEKHRLIIQKNYLELVHRADLNKLLPKLIDKGVFSSRIVEPYYNLNRTELERKRQLFLDIPRRGPTAFVKLIESLREINDIQHVRLSYLLEEKKPPDNNNYNLKPLETALNEISDEEDAAGSYYGGQSGAKPFRFTQNQRPQHLRQLSEEAPFLPINISNEPLKVTVKHSERFMDNQKDYKAPVYPMRSKCRGVYLGINNMEFINDVKNFRHGANFDEENLKDLFKQMGFNITNHRNQTKYDMEQAIRNFADANRNPALKRADCLVVAIMSHGVEGYSKESSEVVTSDGQYLQVSWILEQFDNRNCPEFHKKPKIFIFQICRGDNFNPGLPMTRRIQTDSIDDTRGHNIRNMSDILIAFSTLPGDRSYRDIYLGTWYIQLICKIFMDHAYDTDVERLLKMVDAELSRLRSEDGNMQTSSYESRGFHVCYLNPGLSEMFLSRLVLEILTTMDDVIEYIQGMFFGTGKTNPLPSSLLIILKSLPIGLIIYIYV